MRMNAKAAQTAQVYELPKLEVGVDALARVAHVEKAALTKIRLEVELRCGQYQAAAITLAIAHALNDPDFVRRHGADMGTHLANFIYDSVQLVRA